MDALMKHRSESVLPVLMVEELVTADEVAIDIEPSVSNSLGGCTFCLIIRCQRPRLEADVRRYLLVTFELVARGERAKYK